MTSHKKIAAVIVSSLLLLSQQIEARFAITFQSHFATAYNIVVTKGKKETNGDRIPMYDDDGLPLISKGFIKAAKIYEAVLGMQDTIPEDIRFEDDNADYIFAVSVYNLDDDETPVFSLDLSHHPMRCGKIELKCDYQGDGLYPIYYIAD